MKYLGYFVGLLFFSSFLILVHTEQNEGLLIGIFNVQVFGVTKFEDKDVVDILLKILARYDLVVIQEIRDTKQLAFPQLCTQLNAANDNIYEYTTGPRVGRTSSKEQYGFIYRKDKLEIKAMYQRNDEYDVFEREPTVVRFKRIDGRGQVKEFTFIPLHAKPKDAIAEINNLIGVYEEAEKYYGPDAIIAGDLNADCSYVCKSCWKKVKLRSDSRFLWMILDEEDTTVAKSSCAYDRIILAGDKMKNYACCASVFRFDEHYQLTHDVAADVSDHYPIEFTLA